jgi:HSP20 family protein
MLFDELFRNLATLNRQYRDFGTVENKTPLLNIYQKDKDILVRVLLPGVAKDDIDINYEDYVLTIEGEKKCKEIEKSDLIRGERLEGKFSRSIRLSNKIDASSIKANMKDGVLEISMNTVPEAAPKKIEIS